MAVAAVGSPHPTLSSTEAASTAPWPAKRTAALAHEGESFTASQSTRASKRSRTSGTAVGSTHAAAAGTESHLLGHAGDDVSHHGIDLSAADKPLSKNATEKEKEERRMARMIRNRNAAQASRDRKKEHTAFLERRVAQLEQLLQQAGRPAPAAVAPIPFLGSPTTGPLPPLPGSRLRASSVSSNTSSSEDSGRVADLEDENESLRAQLAAEQGEKARLLTRLELIEEKLARLTTPDAGPISFSPFSGTSTPLPAYEPTFAFNTADIKPLPQPEERAFVEQRERERRRASQTSFDVIAPLAEATYPSFASLSTFRLDVASGSSTPSLSSGSSSSSAGSVSGLELDISSCPATPESYLDLHELDVSPEWSAWAAKSNKNAADAKAGPSVEPHHENADDESALAYLDLSAYHDSMTTTVAMDVRA
ncbi:hypothetical protein BMF94_6076 [Rhodotorula taiwanensis]|uniref:BZIP domain-containing protein n=1 Tax=Rhodotorula taiwanensis TaxID=741276 RepID=A0A2S5B286_9BASI|nr:hypothetical protein BMF94_6076 [Rhodotorula taiwanensis]